MRRLALTLAVLAIPVHAESLCGWTDDAALRSALAGSWAYDGAWSFVTASDEGDPAIEGTAEIAQDGSITVLGVTDVVMPELTPTLGDMVYDVDQVDDLLDTVNADWIADAVSATPCGPEDLPQLSAIYAVDEDLSGQLTLVAYATDQVVLLLEAEWRGDWGLAFVTAATLMTPN